MSSIQTLISTHRTTLTSLYTSLSTGTDPNELVERQFEVLERELKERIDQQRKEVEEVVERERKKVQEAWNKVNDWLTALGETTNQAKTGSEKELPLDQQVKEVERVIEGLRGRIKERGEQVVELHRELEEMKKIVGEDWLEVKLEDVAKGWEELDLKKERRDELQREVVRVQTEITQRREMLNVSASEILALHQELGAPLDGAVIREDPILEEIMLHLGVGGTDRQTKKDMLPTAENVRKVMEKRQLLEEEQQARHQTIQTTYDRLYPLWTMLGVAEEEMDAFVNRFTGSTMDVVAAYQAELDRMLTLRRSNLASFIHAERETLNALWDSLYLSHNERISRFPACTISVDPILQWNEELGIEEELVNENVSEELLNRHERERERTEVELEDAKPVLQRLERYFELVEKEKALEAAAADPSRLTSRGSSAKLLLEERDRKRVAKEKPKLEADLRALIPEWESKHRRPFCVNGVPFLDELDQQQRAAELEKENKRRAKLGTSGSTRPLRPQPTGNQAQNVAPLKRQMTGASMKSVSSTNSSSHQPPPAKRQVPMTTGSSNASSTAAYYSQSQPPPRPKSVLGDASSSRIGNGGGGGGGMAMRTPMTASTASKIGSSTGMRSRSNTVGNNSSIVTPSISTGAVGGGGMRIPSGWGGGGGTNAPSYITPQMTGQFRPNH